MLFKEIQKNLQEYIDKHIEMQMFCFNISVNLNNLGFPGFSYFFQVQAQDEVLHQRRIMNFIMDRNGEYKIKNINIIFSDFKNIHDILNAYYKYRQFFIDITNKFVKNAQLINDFVTNKFYDWFIIDFYKELAEIKDILDWLNISNNDYYNLDKQMLKRKESNILLVINPFSIHM